MLVTKIGGHCCCFQMRFYCCERSYRFNLAKSVAVLTVCGAFYVFSIQVLVPSAVDFLPWKRLEIQQSHVSVCCTRHGSDRDVCNRTGCVPCALHDVKIDLFETLVKKGDEVFFHETSGKSSLDFRQACAVESAARNDPALTINVLMTGDIDATTTTMKSLLRYPNVRISHLNLGNYFRLTPLEQWYFCTDWNYGRYAVSHLSDALRFLTLHKFGGYYLDLDFVMIKPISTQRNFVGAESNEWLAAGALHVDYHHPIIEKAIEEFRTTYRANEWGYNGPELLTRVLLRQCNAKNTTDLLNGRTRDCDFKILPPPTFYPIYFRDWKVYFDSDTGAVNVAKLVNNATVIGAHVWNKFSSLAPVHKNSSQLYSQLARKFCPNTLTEATDIF